MKKKYLIGIIMCMICVVCVLTGCESDEEETSSSRKKKEKNIVNNVTINDTIENNTISNNSIDNSTSNTVSKNNNTTIKKEYSEQELCQMSLDYYEKTFNYRPGHTEATKTDDGKIEIRLYDSFEDHDSTCDRFIVDPKTGKGTNITEQEIDLTPYAK